MGQAMYLDRVNTRLPEILTRSFFAPHGAQSCIALGEGDSHAMPIGYYQVAADEKLCQEWDPQEPGGKGAERDAEGALRGE